MARASARRYMDDQDGMHAMGTAVAALALDPYPPDGFHRGKYHRLRQRLSGLSCTYQFRHVSVLKRREGCIRAGQQRLRPEAGSRSRTGGQGPGPVSGPELPG